MTTERTIRGALIVLAALATARGGYLVLFTLPPRQWPAMLLWLAVGVVIHDVVLAPASLGLGRLLRAVLARRAVGNALRGAWLGAATVVLVGLPLVVGARHRANPTVIPGRPVANLLLSLALVAAGAVAVSLVRAGLSAPGKPARPPATPPPAENRSGPPAE